MYAYVFIKKFDKSVILNGNDITDFTFKKLGVQPECFRRKPFKCKYNGVTHVCQILIVAGMHFFFLYKYFFI